MSEFKFNCPVCGQHILADTAWNGRRINCVSCNTRIIVPASRKEAAKVAGSACKARPKSPGRVMRVRLPDKSKVKVAQADRDLASRKEKPATKKEGPWL